MNGTCHHLIHADGADLDRDRTSHRRNKEPGTQVEKMGRSDI
jgi:hypothetical protein